MKYLIIRQNVKNGASRTWRLRDDQKPHTLGASRLANLNSADPESEGIEGAFESRNGNWYWLNLNPAHLEEAAEVQISEGTEIKLAGSVLQCAFHEKNHEIFEKLEKDTATEVREGTQPYEIEIVKFADKVISTKVVKAGAPESKSAKKARALGGEKVTVIRRPIYLESVKDLTKATAKGMDPESKRSAIAVALSTILFALAAYYGPRTKIEPIAALPPIPAKVTVAMVPTNPKKGTVIEKKMEELAKMPAPKASNDKSSGGRVAGILRAANAGRLSKLLGKVSAQAARSKEVVVTAAGVKAGEGPSGRALAAIGNIDKGSGDWGREAAGKGVSVSTAGRGGGKGTGALGSLSAGNTGSAGVGLIEDESDISGGLDRDVIAGVIKGYLGQILYCYERQLSANPDLFGKVAVKFTIGPNGNVETQAIGDTTLKNATVEGCILNRVAGWKFPSPAGGTKVMVTYPFLFKSTN